MVDNDDDDDDDAEDEYSDSDSSGDTSAYRDDDPDDDDDDSGVTARQFAVSDHRSVINAEEFFSRCNEPAVKAPSWFVVCCDLQADSYALEDENPAVFRFADEDYEDAEKAAMDFQLAKTSDTVSTFIFQGWHTPLWQQVPLAGKCFGSRSVPTGEQTFYVTERRNGRLLDGEEMHVLIEEYQSNL